MKSCTYSVYKLTFVIHFAFVVFHSEFLYFIKKKAKTRNKRNSLACSGVEFCDN